jgi:hypothetical protein
MTDDRTPTPLADVVDFAAFRARRLAEQATLFDLQPVSQEVDAASTRASIGRCSGEPVLTPRAVEHRQRMLRHLGSSKS